MTTRQQDSRSIRAMAIRTAPRTTLASAETLAPGDVAVRPIPLGTAPLPEVSSADHALGPHPCE